MPDITIITDASVDAPTGIAGWCMWAKGHGRSSITRSGVLRTRVRSSVEAEFLAVVNAVHVTLETYRTNGDVVALAAEAGDLADCRAFAARMSAAAKTANGRLARGRRAWERMRALYREGSVGR